ncbi:putative 6-hydroxycyclohex-1-ene-1-carbonyl-CoA dehydrogenase [Magnetospirillum sp. XM-1]|nr:putative 6-hydroxycyclohex-1-ene-1-carbonyl-CoA dehydrogenase [Magnetospirillum sp. XM-1]
MLLKVTEMTSSHYRWQMTEVGKPMSKVPFDPQPLRDDEVLVRVAGCGICHTDLGFFFDGVRTNRDLPLTLGHEISGYVEIAGAGATAWLGKAVLVIASIPCGECDLCRRGKGTICRNQIFLGSDTDGGFASHIKVPARGLCAVDERALNLAGLTLPQVSVVADAVTSPFEAVHQSGLGAGDLAIVNGVGGVGGYCAQIAHAFGAAVVAIDVDQAKLDMIAGYGADLTINARTADGREQKKLIAAFARERGLRSTEWFVFECSGTKAGQENAFGLMVHGSTLGTVGFTMDKAEVRLSNLMALHARALGNWGCLPEKYPLALELVLSGKVNLKDFVETHPLENINEVFHDIHERRLTRRAILIP